MKDVINIELVDNGFVVHGKDFAQVIEDTINQDENILMFDLEVIFTASYAIA